MFSIDRSIHGYVPIGSTLTLIYPLTCVRRSTYHTHTHTTVEHTTAEQTTHTNTERATAQRRLIVEVVVAALKIVVVRDV